MDFFIPRTAMDDLMEVAAELLFSRELKFYLWGDTKGWGFVKGEDM